MAYRPSRSMIRAPGGPQFCGRGGRDPGYRAVGDVDVTRYSPARLPDGGEHEARGGSGFSHKQQATG